MNRRFVAALCGLGLILALPQGARADPNADYPVRVVNAVQCLLTVPEVQLSHRGLCLSHYEYGEITFQPLPFPIDDPSPVVEIYIDGREIYSFVRPDPNGPTSSMYTDLQPAGGLPITGSANSRCYIGPEFTACLIAD